MKKTATSNRVLMTGADGFIGSHLTEMLVHADHQVKALSQYNSFNYWGWLDHIDGLNEVEVLNGDVRDPHYCKSIKQGCRYCISCGCTYSHSI